MTNSTTIEATFTPITCAVCEAPVLVEGSFYCDAHVGGEPVKDDMGNKIKAMLFGTKEELAKAFNLKESTKESAVAGDATIKDKASALMSGAASLLNDAKDKFTMNKEDMTMDNVKAKGKEAIGAASVVGGTAWTSIVKAAGKGSARLMRFVKKHAVKSMFGFAAISVAGMFTTGMVAAVAVGSALYAAVAATLALTVLRKKHVELSRTEVILNALGEGALYGTIGAGAVYHLFYYAVVGLNYAFYYSATVFVYAQYFILA